MRNGRKAATSNWQLAISRRSANLCRHPFCQLPTANCQKGFTLLGLLFLIAGLGVAMAALGTLWHTAAQREKEKDLLFAGDQYRRAITGFWQASPKGQERLPKNFDELLEDPRFPHTVRHLRRLYPDPMTGSVEWGIVKGADGGIAGVYSVSDAVPFKQAGFSPPYEAFKDMPNYRAWIFMLDAGSPSASAETGNEGAPVSSLAANDAKDKETARGQNEDSALAANDAKDKGTARGQNEDSAAMEWAQKLGACEAARMQGYLSCQAVLEQSGKDAWIACVNPVSEQFNACVARR